MLPNFQNYFLENDKLTNGTLSALRSLILKQDKEVTFSWKYKMPFFSYKNKMFCYLWVDKKTGEPYIGFVEGNRMQSKLLEQGNRSRMKILRINPNQDLQIKTIQKLLNEALDFYRKGIIKTK